MQGQRDCVKAAGTNLVPVLGEVKLVGLISLGAAGSPYKEAGARMEEGPRVAPTPVPCPGDGDWAQLFGHPRMGVGSWVIAQPL